MNVWSDPNFDCSLQVGGETVRMSALANDNTESGQARRR